MAIDIPTNNEIVVLMTRLLTNYTELINNFYDVFFNPTPMEVTMKWSDQNGNINTVVIPNRAKDREYILNGQGSPEGVVVASAGTLYQDLLNGEVYIKQSASSALGWFLLITSDMLSNIIQQGLGSPEGVVSASKGIIYVDKTVGEAYIKQTSSGTTGWKKLGDGGSTDTLPTISSLPSIGTISLQNNGYFNCQPTGDITFVLPTITDNTKFYQIVIQLSIASTLYDITLGTSHYFNGIEPEFNINSNYDLIYMYDSIRRVWCCTSVYKN